MSDRGRFIEAVKSIVGKRIAEETIELLDRESEQGTEAARRDPIVLAIEPFHRPVWSPLEHALDDLDG